MNTLLFGYIVLATTMGCLIAILIAMAVTATIEVINKKRSIRQSEECNCDKNLFAGHWNCPEHGPMVAHRDLRVSSG